MTLIMNHQLPPLIYLEQAQSFIPPEVYLEECFDIALKNPTSSQIFSTDNLNLIEELIENLDEDALVLFEYIETFYNKKKRHSTLDYLSPEEYEQKYEKENKRVLSV